MYRERKEKYENIQKRMTDENLCQISLTDSESKLMKMNEGFGVCYNTQTAVDTGSHLIADFEVTDRATDHGQITKLAKKVKEDFREFQEAEDKNLHEIIELLFGLTPETSFCTCLFSTILLYSLFSQFHAKIIISF